jgi:transcriptional regulator GlxA family with amidase domain
MFFSPRARGNARDAAHRGMRLDIENSVDWRVRLIIEVMQRDLDRPLPIAKLADRVNLSPSRFAHLFQRDTGFSPTRYLRELRLDRARALAEESALSVKEIMARVGFNDPSHFTRDFKCRHGVSPRTLRVRARSAGAAIGRRRMSSTIRQRTVESANDEGIRAAVADRILDGSARQIA